MNGPAHFVRSTKLLEAASDELNSARGDVAKAAVFAQMALVESQLALGLATAGLLDDGHRDAGEWAEVDRM